MCPVPESGCHFAMVQGSDVAKFRDVRDRSRRSGGIKEAEGSFTKGPLEVGRSTGAVLPLKSESGERQMEWSGVGTVKDPWLLT